MFYVFQDNYTALHIAVESAKPAVVETLLGYGAEVHIQGGKLKETPLHLGARVPDGDRCVLMLLKSGANPNITTENGQTPVHVAARYGNVNALDLLMEDMGDPVLKSHARLRFLLTFLFYIDYLVLAWRNSTTFSLQKLSSRNRRTSDRIR